MSDTVLPMVLTCLATALLVGLLFSDAGRKSVANDCEKVGAFHVNDKVYHCTPKEPQR